MPKLNSQHGSGQTPSNVAFLHEKASQPIRGAVKGTKFRNVCYTVIQRGRILVLIYIYI